MLKAIPVFGLGVGSNLQRRVAAQRDAGRDDGAGRARMLALAGPAVAIRNRDKARVKASVSFERDCVAVVLSSTMAAFCCVV